MQWDVTCITTSLRGFVEKVIKNVRKIFLKKGILELMTKHVPEFYESIVEASERGELWGIDVFSNDNTQLEFDFDPCYTN
tara:strand:- start:87 stop:326 length:240 start_codon:yes stop_codon:yes gene_type:complete